MTLTAAPLATDGGPALRASAISFPRFYAHNLESARISLAN
jgi:hypothetical protein